VGVTLDGHGLEVMVARGLRLGAILAISLGLAACGSSTTTVSSPVATTSVDLPPSYKFAPADIVVAKGATVTWTNHDNFTHSVQFLDGDLPKDPKTMDPGGNTATFTFDQAGTFHYQCSLHPQNMKGTVTVMP
jgi:plastocyanin